MKYLNSILFTTCFLIFSLLLIGCSQNNKSDKTEDAEASESIKDYQRIIENGKLTVLVENSSTSYFVYRGENMGFEYEILREFAKEIGVELDVKIVANLDNLVDMINNHEGDIISCNYTVTRERTKLIDFSVPYLQTPQVLIQKRKEDPKNIDELIREPIQLSKKHVHVWENSSYYQRLIHLQEEIGDSIYIEPVNGLIGSEELIEQVSQGIIDYTITEENIAQVNSRFYDNIDFSTVISVKQNIAFGLRKESTVLKAKLDKWLTNFLKSKTFKHIYRKYFEIGVAGMNPNNTYSTTGRGKVSPFDDLFKAAGKKHGIDWQIIAAIAYQESKFTPYIEGFGGAYGMMQFMPNTGPKYGVYPNSSPEIQINGGAKKIAADLNAWKNIPDSDQRLKFALASYNAGRGHIEDAQRLAIKHGLNGNMWDGHVEKMILNLSKQEYYRDEVVKSGSWRGTSTFNYVQKVFNRYKEWKSIYR
ncbi:MAG TPA: transporter substrate-binding domain-containing protein [Taishania sp.]|nr:transporter substrate-binding domain-containing protein [Taishania sp.]